MSNLTGYHLKSNELMSDLVTHGFGELRVVVETLKGNDKTKVVIECGKKYVFFVKKKIPMSERNDLI